MKWIRVGIKLLEEF